MAKRDEERSINRARYFVAAVMTISIFLLGLMLGLIVEDKRIRMSQADEKSQELEFKSMQLQYEYINQLSLENNCPAILETFEENIENLEASRIRLENYLKSSKFNKDDFNRLKRDYTISQIQYWLFAKKKKQLCDSEDVSILYFFAEDKACPDCNEQSFVLTYMKKLFGSDLLIFSVNTNFTQEPMISILEKSYNVTEYPTMLIDNRKIEGFRNKDEVLSLICPLYAEEKAHCIGYEEKKDIPEIS